MSGSESAKEPGAQVRTMSSSAAVVSDQEPVSPESPPKLEWVQIQKDLARQRGVLIVNPNVESASDRFRRKFEENPLVPIGCFATGAVLTVGLLSFYRRNTKMSQTMMRARIAAQGFTVFALVVGVFKAASTDLEKRK